MTRIEICMIEEIESKEEIISKHCPGFYLDGTISCIPLNSSIKKCDGYKDDETCIKCWNEEYVE